MRLPLRRLLLPALVALALPGCLPAQEPKGDEPASRLAREALGACRKLAGDAKTGCYEQRLTPLVKRGDVRGALDALKLIGQYDNEVARDGHVYVHGIGIAAFDPKKDVGATFASCTELYHAGCYHGVVQAYFEYKGEVDSAAVNGLCETFRADPAKRWLRFQCVHGLGHGLVMSRAYHLPKALDGCDLLSDWWDRESCYGGAFMENVVNATNPHHGGAAMTSGGGHGGHGATAGGHGSHGAGHGGHGAHGTPAVWKAIDARDPLYPCSALAERYLRQCYTMQTSAILHFTQWKFPEAAKQCDRAPAAWRGTCYMSLGRDATSASQQEPNATRRYCENGSEEMREWCYVGAAKALVDWANRPDDGLRFCATLQGESAIARCAEAVGEQVSVISADPAERRRLCATAPAGDPREACEFGAQARAARPKALLRSALSGS